MEVDSSNLSLIRLMLCNLHKMFIFTFGLDCLSLVAAAAAEADADPESTYMFGMLLPKYTLLFDANAS